MMAGSWRTATVGVGLGLALLGSAAAAGAAEPGYDPTRDPRFTRPRPVVDWAAVQAVAARFEQEAPGAAPAAARPGTGLPAPTYGSPPPPPAPIPEIHGSYAGPAAPGGWWAGPVWGGPGWHPGAWLAPWWERSPRIPWWSLLPRRHSGRHR